MSRFEQFANGSFHIKTKISTLSDLAELLTFFQELEVNQKKCHKTFELYEMLFACMPQRDVVDLVLDFITYYNEDIREHYVDAVSTLIRDRCERYPNDPLKQYLWECHKNGVKPEI